MKSNCPICNEEYTNIDKSFSVCRHHQNWIITICCDCGNVVFSDCAGTCIPCFKKWVGYDTDLEVDLNNATYIAKSKT